LIGVGVVGRKGRVSKMGKKRLKVRFISESRQQQRDTLWTLGKWTM
jgi:hypothetical protein